MTSPDEPLLRPVSVVISTLDRPGQLARCLDALLAGSALPEEIVVVDQGDAVATAALLDRRRRAGVRLVHVTQARKGLSASQNAGVARATCPAVAVIDDDCVPDQHWVEVAAAAHATESPLLLTGRVLPLPPDGDRIVPLSSRTSTVRAALTATALPWDVGTGGNFSVTRQAFLEVDGNDERLGTGTPGQAGNDLDLFRRLLRAGVPARFEPDLLVHHERATSAEHRSRRYTYGFGVGVSVACWLRDGDRFALRVLAAWVTMRLKIAARGRRLRVTADELRVLLGTVHGLGHGWRLGRRRTAAQPTS